MIAGVLALGPHSSRVEIDPGRRMYMECLGSGSPTVLLEAGLRTRGDYWSRKDLVRATATPVMTGVARFTRVCAYDRPGTTIGVAAKDYSRSDPARMPRTAGDAVRDLHALLRVGRLPKPYVLVGHSFGGLIVRLYAATYPHEVEGLVLVDALSEQLRPHMTALRQWKTYLGLISKAPPGLDNYGALEGMNFDTSFAQMRRALAAASPPRVPVVVLSKGRAFDLEGVSVPRGFSSALNASWSRAQGELAAAMHAQHLTIWNSSHNIAVERPDTVVAAIYAVVDALRAR